MKITKFHAVFMLTFFMNTSTRTAEPRIPASTFTPTVLAAAKKASNFGKTDFNPEYDSVKPAEEGYFREGASGNLLMVNHSPKNCSGSTAASSTPLSQFPARCAITPLAAAATHPSFQGPRKRPRTLERYQPIHIKAHQTASAAAAPSGRKKIGHFEENERGDLVSVYNPRTTPWASPSALSSSSPRSSAEYHPFTDPDFRKLFYTHQILSSRPRSPAVASSTVSQDRKDLHESLVSKTVLNEHHQSLKDLLGLIKCEERPEKIIEILDHALRYSRTFLERKELMPIDSPFRLRLKLGFDNANAFKILYNYAVSSMTEAGSTPNLRCVGIYSTVILSYTGMKGCGIYLLDVLAHASDPKSAWPMSPSPIARDT